MHPKGTTIVSSLGNGHSIENWGHSGMADNGQQTDTSTDVDTDDRNQVFFGVSFSANLPVYLLYALLLFVFLNGNFVFLA